jgi:hypothetical protein
MEKDEAVPQAIPETAGYAQVNGAAGPVLLGPRFGAHLYVIQAADGPIKVGRSNDPAARITKLRAGSSQALTLVAVLNDRGHEEGEIHYAMQEYGLVGEWYQNTKSAVAILVRCLGMTPQLKVRRNPKPRALDPLNPWDNPPPLAPDPAALKIAAIKRRQQTATKAWKAKRTPTCPSPAPT